MFLTINLLCNFKFIDLAVCPPAAVTGMSPRTRFLRPGALASLPTAPQVYCRPSPELFRPKKISFSSRLRPGDGGR